MPDRSAPASRRRYRDPLSGRSTPGRRYPGLAAALRLASEQDGMITTGQARAVGLSRGQIAQLLHRGWSSPFRGTLLVPHAPFRGRVRAALAGRPSGVACGLTAARLHGLDGLPTGAGEDEPVHLLVPRSCGGPTPPAVVLHWEGPDAGTDHVDLRGIPVTSVARTLADLILHLPRADAVCLLDAALRSGQITAVDDVRALTLGRHGRARVADWFSLADGRSESALETRLRLLLTDADLPPEQLQWPVRAPSIGSAEAGGTAGRVGPILARLDLAWPSRLLDVEADGAVAHDTPHALYRDRRRQNDVIALGWTVLRFTWTDVLDRPAYVVGAVRRALDRLGARASPAASPTLLGGG